MDYTSKELKMERDLFTKDYTLLIGKHPEDHFRTMFITFGFYKICMAKDNFVEAMKYDKILFEIFTDYFRGMNKKLMEKNMELLEQLAIDFANEYIEINRVRSLKVFMQANPTLTEAGEIAEKMGVDKNEVAFSLKILNNDPETRNYFELIDA